MKQFFKMVFASMLGVLLSSLLLLILFILGVALFVSMAGRPEPVSLLANTVLHATFDHPIPERSPSAPLPGFSFAGVRVKSAMGLNDILQNIRKAAQDPDISGMYLDLSEVPVGWGTLEEIRNALLRFRKSGKFLLAYAERYSQKAYYLASAADRIYLHPEGSLDFRGLSTEMIFFTEALEKLGIEAQVFRVGQYKSAVEPFSAESMSEASREQLGALMNDFYAHFLDSLESRRGVRSERLRQIADSLLIRQPGDALEFGMIDGLKYRDEIIEELKKVSGGKSEEADIPELDLPVVSMEEYTNVPGETWRSQRGARDLIALVYVTGEIVEGEGSDFMSGSDPVSHALREARENDAVKAIVMRVNSPGGSALAADVIWREVKLASQEKPVIVSMGSEAASGGYYVACPADFILAQPTTVTGSIGVFAIIPNMQGFFNEKLGIGFDGLKTGEFSDLGTVTRSMTAAEREVIQGYINDIYGDFREHVAEGRGMSMQDVDSVARGRIWSGKAAVQIGLADSLGGLEDALAVAAREAGLENYRVMEYPMRKSPLEEILGDMGGNIRARLLRQELGRELGAQYNYLEKLQQLKHLFGIRARLPLDFSIR